MFREAIKKSIIRVGRGIFGFFSPPEKIPLECAEAKDLLPSLYERNITVGKLGWKWGDLTADRSLIFLCSVAKMGHTPILEFGTFRGRTTYNLALNCETEITTVDIGHVLGQAIDVEVNIEKQQYASHTTGELFLDAPAEIRSRIKQMRGDSTKLDYSPLYGKMGLVIVDGGHSYEVCKSDSEQALRLIKEGGIIIWDDYGPFWPGVTKALNELSSRIKLYYLPHENMVLHIGGQKPGKV